VTRRGWALFIFVGIIWGLPYLLIRVSIREVTPAFLVFVRTGGGALLLAPFVVRRGALAPLLARWKPLVVLALTELAVPWFFLFNAEKKITSSLAGLLVAAVPIAGAVIARITGTDRLDRRRAAGLVLGIAGVAALVGFDVGGSDLLAASSLLLVVVGYALGPWVMAKYLSDLPGPSVITASLAMCAVLYAPAAIIQRPQHALSGNVIASMVGLTALCTAVGLVAFFALIGEVGPMRSTVVTYVNPAVAVLLGVTVLGEPFGVATGVGFVLVLVGSFLATRPLRPTPERPGLGAVLDADAAPTPYGEAVTAPAGAMGGGGGPGEALPVAPGLSGSARPAVPPGGPGEALPVTPGLSGSPRAAVPPAVPGETLPVAPGLTGSPQPAVPRGVPGEVVPASLSTPLSTRSATEPWRL
jgi:drug/metabolite transporter (DMT)-like permease